MSCFMLMCNVTLYLNVFLENQKLLRLTSGFDDVLPTPPARQSVQ